MLYVYNRYIRTSQVAIPEVDAYDTIHFQCFDCRELAVTSLLLKDSMDSYIQRAKFLARGFQYIQDQSSLFPSS